LAKKELKKPVMPAHAVQSDLKSLRGPQKCNEDCYFELGLSSELCKLSSAAAPDENSYRACVESHFSETCHDCLCDTLADEGTPCATAQLTHKPDKDCYKHCGFVLHLSLELCRLDFASRPDEDSYISCLEDHMKDEHCHDCLCDTLAAER